MAAVARARSHHPRARPRSQHSAGVAVIEFAHPAWLWGLIAAPILVLATIVGGRRRRASLGSFVAAPLQNTLAPGYSWRRYLAKGLLRALALSAILVALAVPRFGSQLVKEIG